MMGLDTDQRERFSEQIKLHATEPLSEKDKELLTTMLTCKTGMLAFGKIYAQALGLPGGFLQLDMATEQGRRDAVFLQGRVQGLVEAIDVLFELVALPEEEDDE